METVTDLLTQLERLDLFHAHNLKSGRRYRFHTTFRPDDPAVKLSGWDEVQQRDEHIWCMKEFTIGADDKPCELLPPIPTPCTIDNMSMVEVFPEMTPKEHQEAARQMPTRGFDWRREQQQAWKAGRRR